MDVAQWIQMSLAVLTFLGLVTVWIQPQIRDRKTRQANAQNLRRRASLYLDVLELKLEKELWFMSNNQESTVQRGEFEKDNRTNFQSLEDILSEAHGLDPPCWKVLMEFVRHFKVTGNMRTRKDASALLENLRNEGLRNAFPQGARLQEAIEELKEE